MRIKIRKRKKERKEGERGTPDQKQTKWFTRRREEGKKARGGGIMPALKAAAEAAITTGRRDLSGVNRHAPQC